MKYRLALTERAQAHIAKAIEWYESDRLGRRDRFIRMLGVAIAILEKHLHVGAPAYHGLRCLPLRRFPYSLFYLVSGDRVEIRACIHQRRKPRERWRRRVRETAVALDL